MIIVNTEANTAACTSMETLVFLWLHRDSIFCKYHSYSKGPWGLLVNYKGDLKGESEL